MNKTEYNLLEAVALATFAPLFFCALHAVDGTRPLVTEFEAGGITGVVLYKLIEVLRTASGRGSR